MPFMWRSLYRMYGGKNKATGTGKQRKQNPHHSMYKPHCIRIKKQKKEKKKKQ